MLALQEIGGKLDFSGTLLPTQKRVILKLPQLKGDIALITGGTTGIGEAVSKLFRGNGTILLAIG